MLEVFRRVIETLESGQIPYMVVGSVASTIYGEPRLTKDMDLVVELLPVRANDLLKLFPETDFYVPPAAIISQEVINRGQFNLIHHASGLKIDFILRRLSPHATEEFGRRVRHPFLPGFDVWIATAEDVIIKKMIYFQEGGSEKHITDIKGILANTPIDTAYIDSWSKRLNVEDVWQTALQ